MVHQTLQGLLLWDRGEMGIPFGLPSTGGGQCGERALATSLTNPRPMVRGSSGGSPAFPRPHAASPRHPLDSTGGESPRVVKDSCTRRLLGLEELRSISGKIQAIPGAIYRGFHTGS
jgi:hypothetical protein